MKTILSTVRGWVVVGVILGSGGALGQTIRYSVNGGGCTALGFEMTRPIAWTASCQDGLIDGIGVLTYMQLQNIAENTSREHEKILYIKGIRSGVLLNISDPNMRGAMNVTNEYTLYMSLYKAGERIGRSNLRISSDNIQSGLSKAKVLFDQAEAQGIPTQQWAGIEKTVRDWFTNARMTSEVFGASRAVNTPADDPKVFGRSARGG